MAKKKYNRGMSNFKIEQLEPRQMFSADVGVCNILDKKKQNQSKLTFFIKSDEPLAPQKRVI